MVVFFLLLGPLLGECVYWSHKYKVYEYVVCNVSRVHTFTIC